MKRKQYSWQLPEEIELRLGETTYGRQRAIFEAEHLFIVLHTAPENDGPERACILFLRTPDGKYLCNGNDGGEKRLRRLLASYDDLFEKYDGLYDESSSATDLFRLMEVVAPVNRAAIHLHSALQSARSHVKGDTFLIAMRDEAYEVSRNLELLLGDAKLALDHRIARNTEAQAEKATEMALAQHKLNILAAVTFPLMGIATLMGMNLVHGFEKWPPSLFWGVVATTAIVGLLVKVWVTRKGNKPRRDRAAVRVARGSS
jgi:hypothetical protein